MSKTASLPPGAMGLPYIGETLAFGRNPFGFLEDRQKRHGNVFKSRLFGRNIVFLAGLEGAEAFYNADNISRADAHPFPLVQLFGGVNIEMYDGPKHLALKSMALEAFNHEAISGYLPAMQDLIETALQRLARQKEFAACTELRRLSIELICANVLGLPPGSQTEAMTMDYGILLPGLIAVPVAVPGATYSRALLARDRILAHIRALIAERRQRPGSDGLSRILTARAANWRTFTDEEALLEVHHIVMAGFIVYAHMAEAMRRLAEQPQLRERCRDEIRQHSASGAISMEALAKLKASMNVVLESKRFVPLVPLAFGKAKRTFDCVGFRVPADWTVYLVLSLNNQDPAIYTNPKAFDPDRFVRGEHRKHPMAFIPQGAEPPTGHRCLGLDYSTFVSLTFLTILVRDYDWELPPQNLEYNWQKLPPEPRDGLRVALRRRNGGPI